MRDFKALLVEIVQIAWVAGLVSLSTLAVDGTKVRANASKHKAMSYKRLKQEERRLCEETESMCDCARQADEAEDMRFGAKRRGDELPEELQHCERRLETIRAANLRRMRPLIEF